MKENIVTLTRQDYDNMVEKCRLLNEELESITNGEIGFVVKEFDAYTQETRVQLVNDDLIENELKELRESINGGYKENQSLKKDLKEKNKEIEVLKSENKRLGDAISFIKNNSDDKGQCESPSFLDRLKYPFGGRK